MVKERKWYLDKVESVIAERADVLGLARDFAEFAEFVGYLVIENDDQTKTLYQITVRNRAGDIANLITKSENVVGQIDTICEALGDTPRNRWALGFREKKTKAGNNYIEVVTAVGYADEKAVDMTGIQVPFNEEN